MVLFVTFVWYIAKRLYILLFLWCRKFSHYNIYLYENISFNIIVGWIVFIFLWG